MEDGSYRQLEVVRGKVHHHEVSHQSQIGLGGINCIEDGLDPAPETVDGVQDKPVLGVCLGGGLVASLLRVHDLTVAITGSN